MAKAKKHVIDRPPSRKASDTASTPQRHATGDLWFDALMNFVEFNEVGPLSTYLETWADGQPAMARQLRDLAQLLRFLSAQSQTPPQGNPGGKWQRWRHPNYVAALVAETGIDNWKRANKVRSISNDMRKKFIEDAVVLINTWHFAQNKPATVERVRRILRDPRDKRI